jgi:ABC-2 type transport system permease protein
MTTMTAAPTSASLGRTVKAEWIKLSSIRSTWC